MAMDLRSEFWLSEWVGQGWGGIMIATEVGAVTGWGEGLVLSGGWVELLPEVQWRLWEASIGNRTDLGKNWLCRASSCFKTRQPKAFV